MKRRYFEVWVTVAATVWSIQAHAQSYPSRPITMVVPYAAGGTFDTLGRIIGARMAELLGQPVIVENTTGAGGIVGVNRVAAAKPDGYTLLLGTVGTHVYNQWIYKKPRYDAANDFTPLEVRKDLPANTLPEFAALLKQNGAKMQYGSAGAGTTSHLACSLLNARIGASAAHVPYRGTAPATNDLLGGQIDYMCVNLGGASQLINGKQVKALALLSDPRSSLMPDLPTVRTSYLLKTSPNVMRRATSDLSDS